MACWRAVLLGTLLLGWGHGEHTGDAWTDTSHGRLLGRRRWENYPLGEGAVTDIVDEYLGVPYAAPPTGQNRFKPPQPLQPWSGALDCQQPGPSCPQVSYYSQTKPDKLSEDCLTLNIYVPYLKAPSSTYPAMVFIHGGSYEDDAAIRYDGYALATHGTIVVTINYRLAVLGFLTTGDSRLPGNNGLLDQLAALRWVAQNLPYFHGDPSRVTVFGNSAGASSIGFLTLSPLSKGLFQAAILQSGSPLAPWAVHNRTVDHVTFVQEVAQRVGCHDYSVDKQIACLQAVPYRKFIEKHWKYPRISPSQMNFKPIVDGYVIPDRPENLLKRRDFVAIRTMVGVVAEEWSRSSGWFFKNLNTSDDNFADGFDRQAFEQCVDYVITNRFWLPKSFADVVIHEYTDWNNKSHPMINRKQYIDFTSDMLMVAPTVKLASALADANPGHNTYFYLIDIPEVHPRSGVWWSRFSYHSIELDYVFGSPFSGYNIGRDKNNTSHSDVEREISRRIMQLWTNFAKHGTPTPRHRSDGISKWETLKSDRLNYYYITADSGQMREPFRPAKMHFWNSLLPKLYEQWWESQRHADAATAISCSPLCWMFVALSVFLIIVTLGLSIHIKLILRRVNSFVFDVTPQSV